MSDTDRTRTTITFTFEHQEGEETRTAADLAIVVLGKLGGILIPVDCPYFSMDISRDLVEATP